MIFTKNFPISVEGRDCLCNSVSSANMRAFNKEKVTSANIVKINVKVGEHWWWLNDQPQSYITTWLHAQLPDRDPHGDCPLPALPLDHPDHHPAPPVCPQHALNLLVGEPEDDADHETLHSKHGLYRVSDKTRILVQIAISNIEKLRVFWKMLHDR